MDILESEPTWTTSIRNGGTVYTRPLLGSELIADQFGLFYQGTSDPVHGITFQTSISIDDLTERLKYGVKKLRFVAPLIASTLERGIHDQQLRSWVYEPLQSSTQAQTWAEETAIFVKDPVDIATFVAGRLINRIPYTLRDGRNQIIRAYLIKDPDSIEKFTLFLHGPHSIMDARPTLNALYIIFEAMSESSQDAFPWGTEWQNLPVGPVTATNGPRREWNSVGLETLGQIAEIVLNPVPTLSLVPQRQTPQVLGLAFRLRHTINSTESARILKTLKKEGLSATHLLDAIQMSAIAIRNPLDKDAAVHAHVTFAMNIIGLGKWLVPPYDRRSHIVSGLTFVPISAPYLKIPQTPDKAALVDLMKQIQCQYDEYLSNPCCPHLTAAATIISPPREPALGTNPNSCMVTNIGVVEQFLPEKFYFGGSASDKVAFSIEDMIVSHRLSSPNPVVHMWGMHGELTLQIQAPDIWDISYLQGFLDDLVERALLLADEE